MSSTKSKFTGERPIAYNKVGLPIFKPSTRQNAIAQNLRKTSALVERAKRHDAGGSGTVHE